MSTCKNRIYFVHIPKTGGVSIEYALGQLTDMEACPAYYWEELVALEDLGRYGVFHGHLQYFCKRMIGDAFTFTILREPIERAISAFEHIRRDTNHPANILLKESPDILSALRNRRLRGHISNAMTRFLGLRPRFEKFKTADAAIRDIMKNYDEEEILEEAKKAIIDMDFVGFTESLNVDQEKLAQKLSPDRTIDLEKEERNKNPERRTETYQELLSSDVLLALKEANRLDYSIYNFAKEIARDKGGKG